MRETEAGLGHVYSKLEPDKGSRGVDPCHHGGVGTVKASGTPRVGPQQFGARLPRGAPSPTAPPSSQWPQFSARKLSGGGQCCRHRPLTVVIRRRLQGDQPASWAGGRAPHTVSPLLTGRLGRVHLWRRTGLLWVVRRRAVGAPRAPGFSTADFLEGAPGQATD